MLSRPNMPLRPPHQRLATLAAFAIAFLFLSWSVYVFVSAAQKRSLAWSIIKPCLQLNQSRKACFNETIVKHTRQRPADAVPLFHGLLGLKRSGRIPDDGRVFSEASHAIGMQMIDDGASLQQALEWCGSGFLQGCIHGAVMEHIDRTQGGAPLLSEAFRLCDQFDSRHDLRRIKYLNCIHALGHEVVAQTSQPIETSLSVCDRLPEEVGPACASGVFMEYSKGDSGRGFHNDEPVGDVPLPCDDVADRWRGICHAGEGSYRQYASGQESWDETLKHCDGVPAGYRIDCARGAITRLYLSTAYDIGEARRSCGRLSPEHARLCRHLLLQVIVQM